MTDYFLTPVGDEQEPDRSRESIRDALVEEFYDVSDKIRDVIEESDTNFSWYIANYITANIDDIVDSYLELYATELGIEDEEDSDD